MSGSVPELINRLIINQEKRLKSMSATDLDAARSFINGQFTDPMDIFCDLNIDITENATVEVKVYSFDPGDYLVYAPMIVLENIQTLCNLYKDDIRRIAQIYSTFIQDSEYELDPRTNKFKIILTYEFLHITGSEVNIDYNEVVEQIEYYNTVYPDILEGPITRIKTVE